jgi:hypothetical protein
MSSADSEVFLAIECFLLALPVVALAFLVLYLGLWLLLQSVRLGHRAFQAVVRFFVRTVGPKWMNVHPHAGDDSLMHYDHCPEPERQPALPPSLWKMATAMERGELEPPTTTFAQSLREALRNSAH